jgi:hypothetical protein
METLMQRCLNCDEGVPSGAPLCDKCQARVDAMTPKEQAAFWKRVLGAVRYERVRARG